MARKASKNNQNASDDAFDDENAHESKRKGALRRFFSKEREAVGDSDAKDSTPLKSVSTMDPDDTNPYRFDTWGGPCQVLPSDKYIDKAHRRTKHDEKRHKEHLNEAREEAAAYAESATGLIGYGGIIGKFMDSVEYYLVGNDEFIKMRGAHLPPQVFIIRGSSGMGKTALVNAVMYEAWKRGSEMDVPIFSKPVRMTELTSDKVGQSEKKTEKVFDDAFKKPTILFIDEAHALVGKGSGEHLTIHSQTDSQIKIRNVMLTKINEMRQKNKTCILILATNDFGALPEELTRRGNEGTFDLDTELKRSDLLEITMRELSKYHVNHLEPEKVLRNLETVILSSDHSSLTPDDIIVAVKKVVSDKAPPISAAEFRKGVKPPTSEDIAMALTHEDFRSKELKRLKDYAVGARSKDVSRIVKKIKPDVSWDDVGGMKKAKNELYTDLELALDERTKEGGVKPITGAILYGPPGTGKTHLTKAIAGKLNATVLIINGAEILKGIQGESETLIRDTFAEARKHAPSIIILDEMDAVTGSRDNTSGNGSMNQVIDTFLAEMGGTKSMDGVVVVGTTNRLNALDPAFKRSGRFDRKIEVNPPETVEEKLEVINVYLRRVNHLLDQSVTDKKILSLFGKHAFTPADIARIISDGAQFRLKELKAARALSLHEKDTSIYEEHTERLYKNLGITEPIPKSADEIGSETLKILSGLNNDNYRLTLHHFETAIGLMRSPNAEKMRKMLSGLRSSATVGKVYGLAAIGDEKGGEASEGTVNPILCLLNPNSKHKPGEATVMGSEIGDSMRVSAQQGMDFLDDIVGNAMQDYQFKIEFISPMKGMDQRSVSGPSAGAAVTIAMFSRITNMSVKPNVVITGAITADGSIFPVGGLGGPKGAGKVIGAQNTEGVDTIVVPQYNYETDFTPETLQALAKQNLKVEPAKTFWDVAKVALMGEPGEVLTEELLKKKLRDAVRMRQIKRENPT